MTATALAAPRALTPPERAKLRAQLKANLKIVSDDDADDAEELVDYALEMVEGGKAAGHVAEELLFMEMPVCGEAEATKVGETLAAFFAGLETDSKDKDDAELQEWLVRIREKKSERLASVQKGRQAAGVRDRIAGLEEGKAKKGGGGVPKTKEGEQHPDAGLEKGKGKDDEGVLVGEKAKEEEHDALPPASSMTVAELKEELRARNDSGYVPHSRLALEAALAAARKKDGAVEAPQAAVKESGGGREEEKTEEGDVEEAVPTAVGIQQRSIAIKQGNEKAGVKEARLDAGRQVKAWVTKPSQDCRLGIGLTGNDGTVRITSIAQDGLFARTNLKVGQVLETINGERCETATKAVARLYAAKGIAIVAYEGMGDIEQGATTSGTSAAGRSAGRDDEVLADVAPGGSRAHPAMTRGAQDQDGKGMGVAIFVLLFLSVVLNFIPSSVALYMGGICVITALVLTSITLCKCCCAADYKLEERDKKFLHVTLLCLVIMFVLGIIGGFSLASNGGTVTSGILVLSGVSFVLIVIAVIFTGLFVWGRDCWSDQRLKRRAITLSSLAFALGLAVVIGVSVPLGNQVQRDLCYSGVDDPLQIGNGVCQLEYNTEECWLDGGDCLHYNELRASYPGCRIQESVISWGDGVCDNSLNSKECGYDGGDCREFNAKYPDCQVDRTKLGDGRCDGIGYSEACGWDGNDCEVDGYPNCASEYLLRHGGKNLVWGQVGWRDQVFMPGQVGNGICTGPYNLEACGFDGGDCLESNERIAEMYPDCHVDSTKVFRLPCTKECGWSDGNSNKFANCVPPIGDGSCTYTTTGPWREDMACDEEPKGSIGSSSCNGDSSCRGARGNIGDSACNGKDVCVAAEGDIGDNSCTGGYGACEFTKGNIGANACKGRNACTRMEGDIENDACYGGFACSNTKGDIGANACNGTTACTRAKGDIGANSCHGLNACAYTGGTIGANSCNAKSACRGNTTDIPANSCNEKCECAEDCRLW